MFAFSDDTGVIAVSDSFAMNCKMLTEAMGICNIWAAETGMEFAYHKFECMHFSKSRADSESRGWTSLPEIAGLVRGPNFQKRMRVLGVIFDPRLNWKEHMIHVSADSRLQLRVSLNRLRWNA